MLLRNFDEQIVYLSRAAKVDIGGISSEGEHEQDDQNHHGMRIIGQERRFDTTKHGIQHHTNRQQETSRRGRHPSERSNDGGPSREQHGRHQDISEQAEYHENDVRDWPIARSDDLQEGMGVGRSSLEFNGNGGEEDDLHSCARGIPEWA